MKLNEAIESLKQNSKKRKFKQTFDLVISLTNINLKNPESQISKEIALPSGRGRDIKVGVIGEKEDINKQKLEELGKNKKEAKKFAEEYDFFVAEAPLMPTVGKTVGRFLAPRGKMPKPMPPGADKSKFIELAKKTVRINVKKTPVIHCPVGTEDMSVEDIENNCKKIIDEVKNTLPKGEAQVKALYVKLTMSKPVKIE